MSCHLNNGNLVDSKFKLIIINYGTHKMVKLCLSTLQSIIDTINQKTLPLIIQHNVRSSRVQTYNANHKQYDETEF